MSTETQISARSTAGISAIAVGAALVALSGVGLVGYGVLFLVQNFTSFIEIGLTADNVGAVPAQLLATNPLLYDYISHVQVALAGVMIGLGVAIIALAWYGIRRGEHWALWTAFGSSAISLAIGLPMHYPFGLATLGHLGPIYVNMVLLAAGTIVSLKAWPK